MQWGMGHAGSAVDMRAFSWSCHSQSDPSSGKIHLWGLSSMGSIVHFLCAPTSQGIPSQLQCPSSYRDYLLIDRPSSREKPVIEANTIQIESNEWLMRTGHK